MNRKETIKFLGGIAERSRNFCLSTGNELATIKD